MKLCGETDKTLLYQLQKCNCSSHNTFLIVELEEGCQINESLQCQGLIANELIENVKQLTTSIVEMIEIKQDLLSIFFAILTRVRNGLFRREEES